MKINWWIFGHKFKQNYQLRKRLIVRKTSKKWQFIKDWLSLLSILHIQPIYPMSHLIIQKKTEYKCCTQNFHEVWMLYKYTLCSLDTICYYSLSLPLSSFILSSVHYFILQNFKYWMRISVFVEWIQIFCSWLFLTIKLNFYSIFCQT